jgi:hypothetical protein
LAEHHSLVLQLSVPCDARVVSLPLLLLLLALALALLLLLLLKVVSRQW